MATKEQFAFLEVFETSRPPNSVFCHQEFLEKLAVHDRDSLGRSTAFLMQRLSVDARRLHYKATHGVNRGWRRSRLGGNRGSHFYAWWAPKNAIPLNESGEFPMSRRCRISARHSPSRRSLADDSACVRRTLPAGDRTQTPAWDTRPYPGRSRAGAVCFGTAAGAASEGGILVRGRPPRCGMRPTRASAERVLYVTYSRDLASLARDYFDRFCSSHKQFEVVTFRNPGAASAWAGHDADS